MNREVEIPLSHIIGIELRSAMPGAAAAVELDMIKCNIPLPPKHLEGQSIIQITLHTTDGDINVNVNQLNPVRQVAIVARSTAEAMLSSALTEHHQAARAA